MSADISPPPSNHDTLDLLFKLINKCPTSKFQTSRSSNEQQSSLQLKRPNMSVSCTSHQRSNKWLTDGQRGKPSKQRSTILIRDTHREEKDYTLRIRHSPRATRTPVRRGPYRRRFSGPA